jgi:formylglycine-generating enzyme required for sulfatase activity
MGACCAPSSANHPRSAGDIARGSEVHDLVPIDGGDFLMGNDGPDAVPGDGEGPVRRMHVDAFSIAPTTVTNCEFGDFVRDTRYVTDAERNGLSFVFYLQLTEAQRRDARRVVPGIPWWVEVTDASWQRPEGLGSNVHMRPDLPVTHVSWHDAQAYCAWSGTRLPDEVEWERAARGGLERKRFPWGDELWRDDEPRCNVWRGTFPNAPAPRWRPGPIEAGAGEPNRFGLYNMCGNVWEWCADWFTPGRRNLRGGSFLCHDSYCNRYRVAARNSNTPSTTASNIGFRVAA